MAPVAPISAINRFNLLLGFAFGCFLIICKNKKFNSKIHFMI